MAVSVNPFEFMGNLIPRHLLVISLVPQTTFCWKWLFQVRWGPCLVCDPPRTNVTALTQIEMVTKVFFAIRDCAVRILPSPNSAEKDNFNQKELGILFPPQMFVMEQEQRVAWLSVEKFHLNENCQSGRSFNRWKFYFICTPHQLFTTGNNFKRSLTKNSEFWKVLTHDQHQTNVTSKHWTLGSWLVGCRGLLAIVRKLVILN